MTCSFITLCVGVSPCHMLTCQGDGDQTPPKRAKPNADAFAAETFDQHLRRFDVMNDHHENPVPEDENPTTPPRGD